MWKGGGGVILQYGVSIKIGFHHKQATKVLSYVINYSMH